MDLRPRMGYERTDPEDEAMGEPAVSLGCSRDNVDSELDRLLGDLGGTGSSSTSWSSEDSEIVEPVSE